MSYTIVPGFVDVHIHGCAGADACDGTRESLETMARFLLEHGVTSFCPTTMTVRPGPPWSRRCWPPRTRWITRWKAAPAL